MNTQVPTQYASPLRKFLHTKLGAKVGFALGLSGFNHIHIEHRDQFGNLKGVRKSYNSRVNKGADLVASLISGTSFNSISSPLPPKYVALSTATLTPDKTDTTLASEISDTGLSRALGTQGSYTGPSVLDGAASYTVTKTFTASGSKTVVSAALFDASSSGNLFVEANLSSSVVMANNDTLAITWTINL